MQNEQKKQTKIFSESFKREKVQMIERGEVTASQIKTLYDISYPCLYNWRKKYGTLVATDRIVIEKESDYLKVVELSKKLAEMERLVGRQQIRLDYYSGVVNQAKVHYGEDIEKKFGTV